METFEASVQYGDWEGTASADAVHDGSVHQYLQTKGLADDDEFVLATSLWAGEGTVRVRVYLFKGEQNFEDVRRTLAAIEGPIPVRAVDLSLTLEDFVGLFKRFNVLLTWQGLSLQGHEYVER